MKAHMAFVTR
jgi:hypothetical protein